jgi:hypothetical protein
MGERYAFLVEWLDPNAQIVWKFQLLYWDADCSCELYDIKNRRTFLKRCPAPHVKLPNLYLGAVVTLHSRQLKVMEYSDAFTQNTLAKSRQKCAPLKARGRAVLRCPPRVVAAVHTEQHARPTAIVATTPTKPWLTIWLPLKRASAARWSSKHPCRIRSQGHASMSY